VLRAATPFNFCVIDEVDSILIDEARTPLIISGVSDQPRWGGGPAVGGGGERGVRSQSGATLLIMSGVSDRPRCAFVWGGLAPGGGSVGRGVRPPSSCARPRGPPPHAPPHQHAPHPAPPPTPPPQPPSDKYYKAAKIADALTKDVHYTVDEKQRSVLLTEDGCGPAGGPGHRLEAGVA
jgi:hypothetical protein